MFKIQNIENTHRLLDHFHIQGPRCSARIYPNLGGSLQEFILADQPIISGINIDNPESYWKTYSSAILFPFPGRVAHGTYHYNNNTYQLEVNETQRQNALHGLVYNKEFKLQSMDASTTEAQITFEYQSDGTLQGFPFLFQLELHYSFNSHGCTLKAKVINTDEQNFPFALGWHPYFFTNSVNHARVTYDASEAFITNASMIPIKSRIISNDSNQIIGNQHLDHAYLLNSPQTNFYTEAYTLSLSQKGSPQNYLQLFTPDHRQALAIEPMTALPNAFNNKHGLLELAPNASFECQWLLKLTYS